MFAFTRRFKQLRKQVFRVAFSILPAGDRRLRGINLNRDIALLDSMVAVDIGCFEGEFTRTYLSNFSSVWCFEPLATPVVPAHCVVERMAVGSKNGFVSMEQTCGSGNHVLDERGGNIPITSLDEYFANVLDVDKWRINLLKVDVEGFELSVLNGARKLLKLKKIDAVYIEAGMNVRNGKHVYWQALSKHMENQGFLLFGIYEQVSQAPYFKLTGLRRADLLFIRADLCEGDWSY